MKNMFPSYVVVSNDTSAFFLGRYENKRSAIKAMGSTPGKWVLYKECEGETK